MKRVLKWLAYGLGGLVGLALITVIALYVRSEWILSKTWEAPPEALRLSPRAVSEASVEEGKRLAQVFGCFNGCHGQGADGGVFVDIPNVVKLVAPSLTHRASTASNAELIRSIRFGIRDDGTSVWGMPSAAFYHLSDVQLASIIAFLRSLPVGNPIEEESVFRPLSRLGIAMGDFAPAPATTTSMPQRLGPEYSDEPHALGRQLAVAACSECHGSQLEGNPQLPAPALVIVQGYDRESFHHFMKTGEALGGRQVGLMTEMARLRFSNLRAGEVDALYAYLSETGGTDLADTEAGLD